MRFFATLRQNLTSVQSYWQTLHFPLRSSVLYWIRTYLFLLAASCIAVIAIALSTQHIIEEQYPQQLTFTYVDGVLSSNEPLPRSTSILGYTITASEQAIIFGSGPESYAAPFSEFMTDVPPFQVTKQSAKQFLPTMVPLFGIMFALTCIVMVAVLRFPMLLLYTLIIQSVMALFGRKLPYAVILQLGLHAAVVAELLNLVYLVLYRSRNFPMYDVVFFGIMIWVLRSRRVQIVQIG